MNEVPEEVRKQLIADILATNQLQEAQRPDEFTVRYYASVIECKRGKARVILEKLVADGEATVRRNVRITWTVGTPNGCVGDVYKLVKRKKK